MKRILFPLPPTQNESSPQTDAADMDKVSPQNWKGITPFEMVELIADQANRNYQASQNPSTPCIAERRMSTPLRIDTLALAAKETRDLPNVTPFLGINENFFGKDSHDYGKLESRIVSFDTDDDMEDQDASKPNSFASRKRTKRNDDGDNPSLSLNTVVPSNSDVAWDPSFLIENYADIHDATTAYGAITSHVKGLESMHNFTSCLPSYKRLQDDIFAKVEYIHANIIPQEEKVFEFRCLYQSTVHQMIELKNMVEAMDEDSKGKTEKIKETPSYQMLAPYDKTKHNMKDVMQMYLESWMKNNWTNPFPNHEELEHMSKELGSKPSIVNKWFIDTRSCRWRPALDIASKNDRPASMLVEDSMRIFDKKPLRPLETDGESCHEDQESTFPVVNFTQQMM